MPKDPPHAPDQRRQRAILIGLWIGLALFYTALQLGRRTPSVFNDELIFGRTAQNLANGDGFTWRHVEAPLRSVYPILIAPAWLLFKGMTAYRVALLLNALTMTAALFPTFLLARRLTSFGYAAAAGAGAVLIPSMVWSGMLMTESLAYPLTALAMLAMVNVLRTPGFRSTLLAAAAVLAAAATRPQLLALGWVFFAAVTLDIFRFGRAGLRDRLYAQRYALTGIGLALAAALTLFAFGPLSTETVLGPYAMTSHKAVDVGELSKFALRYIGGLSAAVLGLPLVAMFALAARRANWRDPDTGPLITVAATASILFLAIGAWFATVESQEVRERYVFYAMPPLAACWVALPGRTGWRTIAIVTGALSLAIWIFFPAFSLNGSWEGWIQFGLQHFGSSKNVFIAMVIATGLAAALAIRLRGGERAALLLVPLLTIGAITTASGQRAANADSRSVEAQIPRPFDWVDRASPGPAALMGLPRTSILHIANFELWNRKFDRLLTFPTPDEADLAGPTCHAKVAWNGKISAEAACGASLPDNLVFAEESSRIAMQNALRVVEPGLGKGRSVGNQFTRYGQLFVFGPKSTPRIRSLITGCGEEVCSGTVSADLWSLTGGTLRVTVGLSSGPGRRGSQPSSQVAVIGPSRRGFSSDGRATAVVTLPAGHSRLGIRALGRRSGGPTPFELLAADYRPHRRAAVHRGASG